MDILSSAFSALFLHFWFHPLVIYTFGVQLRLQHNILDISTDATLLHAHKENVQ